MHHLRDSTLCGDDGLGELADIEESSGVEDSCNCQEPPSPAERRCSAGQIGLDDGHRGI